MVLRSTAPRFRRTPRKPMSRCSTAQIAGWRSRTGRYSRSSITQRPHRGRATAIICSPASSISRAHRVIVAPAPDGLARPAPWFANPGRSAEERLWPTAAEQAAPCEVDLTAFGRRRAMAQPSNNRVRRIEPATWLFADDGLVPNNPALPLVIYRGAIDVTHARDPAALFEAAFARNGWAQSWRNGIYPFAHYHSMCHEVLGIARGAACVRFG